MFLVLSHFLFITFSGYDDEKSLSMSKKNFEKRFGQSPVFLASTLLEEGGVPPSSSPAGLLKEAIHVISCGYEDKTDWGQEVNKQKNLSFLIDATGKAQLTISHCENIRVVNLNITPFYVKKINRISCFLLSNA